MPDETLEPASLRLPASLATAIRKRAKANRRSLNSEVIVLLEQAVAEAEAKESEAA